MHSKISLLLGVTLIALALFAVVGQIIVTTNNSSSLHMRLYTWPLAVIAIGFLFLLTPFIFRQPKGLGGLLIPGALILVTGCLLFISSTTSNWALWTKFWPLEILGIALGFVLSAIFLRVIWLMIPASILGLTGIAFLICTLTNAWGIWGVMWTIIPFSIGLPLLIIGTFKKINGLRLSGLIICGFSGLAFTAMSAIIASPNWITKIAGPATILLLGLLMVGSALQKTRTK